MWGSSSESRSAHPSHPSRRVRRMRRTVAGTAAGLMALALAPALLSQTAGPLAPAAAAACPASRPAQMVQANVKTGMTAAQTSADLAKVFADRPDFVTLNEVHGRTDSALAQKGYALWRTPGKYTGANAVMWRTDRWSAIARGTAYLTIQGGIPPGKKTELGIRYANWATLRSADGCQTISVIAFHVAPEGDLTSRLIGPSVDKLGGLATWLSAKGPVLLGGDLNRHYKAKVYPQAKLASYKLSSNWYMAGKVLPTGDYKGATVDYIFMRHAAQFSLTSQLTRELNSDHDAVVANLRVAHDAKTPADPRTFVRVHVVNDTVNSTWEAKRPVVNELIEAIKRTPKAATIRAGTSRLGDVDVFRALRDAFKRGVNVQVVTTSATPSPREQDLVALLKSSKTRSSWIVRRAARPSAAMPPTAVVITKTANVKLFAVQVDRPLDSWMSYHPARGMFSLEDADYKTVNAAFLRQAK